MVNITEFQKVYFRIKFILYFWFAFRSIHPVTNLRIGQIGHSYGPALRMPAQLLSI